MRILAIAIVALGLGACAATGPTAYGPDDGKFGYSETRVEEGRYRIVYRGSGGMPPQMVEDFALRRAGELAIQNGFEWFRLIARDIERDDRGGVGLGAGFGTGSYGRRSGVGVGVGGNLGTIGSQTFYTVRIETLMGIGDAPDNVDVYDARSIIETLAGQG